MKLWYVFHLILLEELEFGNSVVVHVYQSTQSVEVWTLGTGVLHVCCCY